MIDWQAIKLFYQETRSLKATAERFGVSLNTIRTRCRRENWANADVQACLDVQVPQESNVQIERNREHPLESKVQADVHCATREHPDCASDVQNDRNSESPREPDVQRDVHREDREHPDHASDVQSNPEAEHCPEPDADRGSDRDAGGAVPFPAAMPSDPHAAVLLYRSLGMAVHPCHGPAEGAAKERGKKPRFSGWTQWSAADLTDEIVSRYFGPAAAQPSNIGCRIVPPLIAIDLDSKIDQGASVREWLAAQSALAAVPRERSGNGAHLWFVCRDLPSFAKKNGQPLDKPIFAQITGAVHAELFFTGNLILSPSVHASGALYYWEVSGPAPEVKWAQLQDWFGFENPNANTESESRPRGRPKKEKPWWSRFQGELTTLDLVALAQEAGIYGELRDADERKHSVRCPWAHEHSDTGSAWNSRCTETVIYEAGHSHLPGFKCLHAHCAERALQDLVEWAEAQRPGIVDRHCATARVWQKGQTADDGSRPRVVLSGPGRPDSVFAAEVGALIGTKRGWFNFADNVVVIRESADTERIGRGLVMHTMRSIEAITEAEEHVELGYLNKDEAGDTVFCAHSMSEACSRVLLASKKLRSQLPIIRRVLDVPLPVIHEGVLVYPSPGYDPRFKTYMAPDAPELFSMSLDEAKALLLDEVLGTRDAGGFCWKDEQSRVHAIARLITPFCRGLMKWARAPLWIFEANRERCGKDYLAQVTCMAHLGRQVMFSPPSKDSDEELRKRITTALMAYARIIHFANMKGHIRFAGLEAATDNSGVWQDRILGGNTEAYLPNEAEFSFSANSGTSWEPDIEGRSRRIALHWDKEFINERRFRHTDLHDFILTNRAAILSAMAAFVTEWDRQGRPAGPNGFSSFPQWARVVGGVMHACGLGDPCLPHADKAAVTGDQTTENMKALFSLAADEFGDRFVKKPELYDLVERQQDGNIFDWIDLKTRAGQTMLGKLLAKYVGRELGGVRLSMPPTGKNNLQYRFLRVHDTPDDSPQEGTSETSGTFACPTYDEKKFDESQGNRKEEDIYSTVYSGRENVPEVLAVPVLLVDGAVLDGIAEEIAISEAPVALDIETYRADGKGGALNPYERGGEIRILALCLPAREPWLLDLRALGYDLGPLAGVLESAEVVGQNLKFDLLWLRAKCGLNVRKAFCTMTASRLLTAGSKEPNDLGAVVQRHLEIKLPKDQGRSDWGGMFLTPDQLAYSANDVRHLHALRAKLDIAIDQSELRQVADLEMQLLPVVVDVEAAGFPVDGQKFQNIACEAMSLASEVAARIRAAFRDETLNVASPVQLKEAFKNIGLEVPDTGVQTLSEVDHETARLVLEFRGYEKLAQQANSLLEATGPDGRIHARFEPTGTETGRFSSRDPNMQNVGRGELRNAFVAPEGFALVIADYSQIELRGAAAIANDQAMLDAYRRGEDLHRKTAALVLGKPESEVTKHDRQIAKAVGFGLLYGQSAKGLVSYAKTAYGVTITEEEAARFRERFFVSYRGLAAWHREAWRGAREIGGRPDCEVRTRAGRRRMLPRGGEDWYRFTALVNTSVQGTCADGLKQAMVNLSAQLPEGVRIIATVHDELVLTAPAALAEEVRDLVVKTMCQAMGEMLPEVPVEVEAKICKCWGEK